MAQPARRVRQVQVVAVRGAREAQRSCASFVLIAIERVGKACH
jgi:hypothetical protein